MARKVTDKPQRFCWDCVFAKVYEDERYVTPSGEYIFKHCYLDPNRVKRGIMDNTKACSQFKESRLYD